MKAVQYPHQCRFASTVFPQQRMHFPPAHVKVYLIAGQDARKPFDDSVHQRKGRIQAEIDRAMPSSGSGNSVDKQIFNLALTGGHERWW